MPGHNDEANGGGEAEEQQLNEAELAELWEREDWFVRWRRDRLVRKADGSWGQERDGKVRRVVYPVD